VAGAEERTAVLVVRAWKETGAEGSLRARVTSTLDVSVSGDEETLVAASEQEIVEIVRTWLQAVTAR
jgi:hypothetical protein